MKRNLLFSLLVVATSFVLVGCGEKKQTPTSVAPTEEVAQQEKTKELATEHTEEAAHHEEGKELSHHGA